MSKRPVRLKLILTLALAGSLALASVAAVAGSRRLEPLRLLAQLAARVDLSSAQRDEIRAILERHHDAVVGFIRAEASARSQLGEAIHQPTLDDQAVRDASAAVAAVDADFAVERAGLYAEVSAVLTPDQRAEIETFISDVRPMVEREVERSLGPKAGMRAGGLTSDQRDQIHAILADHRPAFEALLTRELDARSALGDAIRQPAIDEAAIRQASAVVSDVDAELAVERAHTASEIAAVLTPEQRLRVTAAANRLATALADRAQTAYDLGMRLL